MSSPKGFSSEQIAALSAPLNPAHVKQRKQGPVRVSYIEGWHAIEEANRIFGFHAWNRETTYLDCVYQAERLIGRDQKPGWSVTYRATVKITVDVGTCLVIREGSGSGHGIDVDLGQAHESALKEAETDAMKRALMTFGNPFGLALYDKEQRNVGDPETEPKPADGFLLAKAMDVCTKAGLTPAGFVNLAIKVTKGKTDQFVNVPEDILQRIIDKGISPETIAQCNGNHTPSPQ